MPKLAEELFCVPREWCDEMFPAGVTPVEQVIPTILGDAPFVFADRADAETRDDIVQLATYVIVRNNDRVLYYGRGGGGGEGALRGRLSLGVGGHVEAADLRHAGTVAYLLERAAFRELHEELIIPSLVSFDFAGYIRNVDDAVGLRHLGLLYEARTFDRDVRSNEPDKIADPVFAPISAIIEGHYDRLERWSQLVARHLGDHGNKGK